MIPSTILDFAKKTEKMQQIPLEDYVICIILCQEAEDTLEETKDYDELAAMQDAELSLRERYQDICNRYLQFQEEQRLSDMRDGLREFTRRTRYIPVKEHSLFEQEMSFFENMER